MNSPLTSTILIRVSDLFHNHKLLIFFVPFLVYMSNGREISSGDPTPTVFVAINLVKQGTFYLDDLHDYIPYPTLPYYVSKQKGHIVSNYPLLPGLMAAPVFAPFVWMGMLEKNEGDLVWKYLSKLTGSLYTALSVLFLYLCLERLINRSGAWLLSMAYGLGTALWPIASQSLWQHGPSIFWWTVALYALIRAEQNNSLRQLKVFLFFSGIAVGCAVLCRTVNGIGYAGLTFLVFLRFRRHFFYFFLPASILTGLLLVYNLYVFGSWKGGDSVLHQLHWELDRVRSGSWSTPLWIGLPGQLISPSRGIFVFSPFLIFSFWGMIYVAKKTDSVWNSVLLLIPIPLTMLLVFSLYAVWWGGNSHYGPRYQIETYPFLMLLLAAVWDRIQSSKPLCWLFLLLLVYSLFVQWIGAFCYPGGWEMIPVSLSEDYGRLWDWDYNQIWTTLKSGIKRPFS